MMTITGGIVGFVAACGILLAIWAAPPLRRTTLADRIAPHLRDAPAPSRLLAAPHAAAPRLLSRLTAPLVADVVRFLDRFVGGRASIARRLTSLGSPLSVEQFRAEQVLWAGAGFGCGLGAALLAITTNHRSPILVIALILGGVVIGALGRDWWLSQAVARRDAEILDEFPVVADMLALAVTAGESPAGALARICRLTQGHLSQIFGSIIADTRAGAPLKQALQAARDRTALEPLSRFLDGMAVAIERGTPLSEVLRAQAADVRAMGKRHLLEIGGKKEIAMMIPVVFVVLPVTILFAFYPGLVAITTVAQ